MTSINEIFDVAPEEWIKALPAYQQSTIADMYSEFGDYEKVAQEWLSPSNPMNVPFGASHGSKLYFEKVLDELEAFFRGDKRYEENRMAILKESGAVQNYVVGIISGALALQLGAAAVFIAPSVAIGLLTIGKMGINAWLAYREETRKTE